MGESGAGLGTTLGSLGMISRDSRVHSIKKKKSLADDTATETCLDVTDVTVLTVFYAMSGS